MRDGRRRRRTREDRATQPMDAGWLSFAIFLPEQICSGGQNFMNRHVHCRFSYILSLRLYMVMKMSKFIPKTIAKAICYRIFTFGIKE